MKVLLYVYFILFVTNESTGQPTDLNSKCVFKRRVKYVEMVM